MRVLLIAPPGDLLERELAALGHDVVRGDVRAPGAVTVAPAVELQPLAELEPETWVATFREWAEEPFFSVQPWLAAALERGSGCWVAVTSSLGTQPFPGAGAAGVAATALHTLVRVAAIEGGPRGVRANAVAPGWREPLPARLDPELAVYDTPGRRLATTADVASAVVWLLSDEASHVNGEVVRVDGGYTITRGSRPSPEKGG
jgi:NAD(P)-dependent dehydrogenase (short-subunit alcohol dehydrogenase family)